MVWMLEVNCRLGNCEGDVSVEINDDLCAVVKPQGATTPAAVIPFEDLITYGVIFSSEVDTATATAATTEWLQGGLRWSPHCD